MADSELVDGNMVFHHTMPKRWDQGMSVRQFRRKLRGHPDDATVNGLLRVQGDRLTMYVDRHSPATVATLRDDLKPHIGLQLTALDLHVTVDLKAQAAKARRGIDPKAVLPAGEVVA